MHGKLCIIVHPPPPVFISLDGVTSVVALDLDRYVYFWLFWILSESAPYGTVPGTPPVQVYYIGTDPDTEI